MERFVWRKPAMQYLGLVGWDCCIIVANLCAFSGHLMTAILLHLGFAKRTSRMVRIVCGPDVLQTSLQPPIAEHGGCEDGHCEERGCTMLDVAAESKPASKGPTAPFLTLEAGAS